jgi:outer membrane lipoprotein-sorting protein
MTRLRQAMNSVARCSFPTLLLLLLRLPVVAQELTVSAPLTADQVIDRLAEMNQVRAKSLESYSSVRSYHLECHCLSHKTADMVVRADYQAPNQKVFTIISESGSGTVRNRAFKKLLEAEQESMQEENQQRSAITPENYTFRLSEYQKTDTEEFYVLEAQPRTKNKFLFRGRIWVDAKDFAITRVEGEPAANPSWWTVKTDFKRRYQKIGDFWLPESNESETKVRVFGTAFLTIEYRDYQITTAGARCTAYVLGAACKIEGSLSCGSACQRVPERRCSSPNISTWSWSAPVMPAVRRQWPRHAWA